MQKERDEHNSIVYGQMQPDFTDICDKQCNFEQNGYVGNYAVQHVTSIQLVCQNIPLVFYSVSSNAQRVLRYYRFCHYYLKKHDCTANNVFSVRRIISLHGSIYFRHNI